MQPLSGFFAFIAAASLACGRGGKALNPSDDKVNVEFFWTAQCPDAERCVKNYMPTLQRLANFVDVRVTHLVDVNDDGTSKGKYLEDEIVGSRHQLCAERHLRDNTSAFLEFLSCHGENVDMIPGNTEACGQRVGLGMQQLECPEGQMLLMESIRRAREKGVSSSCTVHVQDDEYCKDNGGMAWQQCSGDCESAACLKHAVCSLSDVGGEGEVCQKTYPDEVENEEDSDDDDEPTPCPPCNCDSVDEDCAPAPYAALDEMDGDEESNDEEEEGGEDSVDDAHEREVAYEYDANERDEIADDDAHGRQETKSDNDDDDAENGDDNDNADVDDGDDAQERDETADSDERVHNPSCPRTETKATLNSLDHLIARLEAEGDEHSNPPERWYRKRR